jgi:hypothetical protein
MGPGGVDAGAMKAKMQQAMSPVAKALGMTTDELTQSLQRGKSLSDIATAKGVSNQDLVAAIKQGLESNAPEGAPNLSSSQLDNFASRIAGHRGLGGPGDPGSPEKTNKNSADDYLQQLLDALDTTKSSKNGWQTNKASSFDELA